MSTNTKDSKVTKNTFDFSYYMKLDLNGVEISSDWILGYSEVKDYMSMMLPIRVMEIAVPYSTMRKIISDKWIKDDRPVIKSVLDISCVDQSQGLSTIPKSIRYGTFNAVIDFDVAKLSEADAAAAKNNNSPDELDKDMRFYKFRMAFYTDAELRNINSNLIGGVMNGTVAGAMLHAVNKCIPGVKLAMSPVTSQSRLDQDIVSPKGFYQFIDHLVANYGVYDSGMNMFLEEDTFFIMNKRREHGLNMSEMLEDRFGRLHIQGVNENNTNSTVPELAMTKDNGLTVYLPEVYGIMYHSSLNQYGQSSETSIVNGVAQSKSAMNAGTTATFRATTYSAPKKLSYETCTVSIPMVPVDVRAFTRVRVTQKSKSKDSVLRVSSYEMQVSKNGMATTIKLFGEVQKESKEKV